MMVNPFSETVFMPSHQAIMRYLQEIYKMLFSILNSMNAYL